MAGTVQQFSYKVKGTKCHWRYTKGWVKLDGENKTSNFY